jgi:transposase
MSPLRRQLNAIKREQFPWMLEVTKNAPQMAIIQLGAAFKNFFAGRTKYPNGTATRQVPFWRLREGMERFCRQPDYIR